MPWILWALLSLISGWCFHSFFTRRPPPRSRPKTPEFPASTTWERIGEVESTPSAENANDLSDDQHQLILGAGIVLGVVLMTIGFAQMADNTVGFRLEELLVTSPNATMLFWFSAGFVFSAYRDTLARLSLALFNIVSNSENTVLWPVQAALALSLFVGVLLFLNPGLIEKLSSFKAGGVEANFSADAARIRNAPVNFLYISRQGYSEWDDFKIVDISKHQIDWSPEQDQSNYKSEVYRRLSVPFWRPAIAQAIFEDDLNPLFHIISCYRVINKIDLVKNNDKIANFTLDFQNLIERSFAEHIKAEDISELLDLLKGESKDIEAELDDKAASQGPWEQSKKFTFLDAPPECKFLEGSPQRKDYVSQIFKLLPKETQAADVWDLYLVAAVADLISITRDETAEAGFLERVREHLNMQSSACGEIKCNYTLPSQTNFFYYVTNAKITSEAPWPLDESVADLRTDLTNIYGILSADNLGSSADAQYRLILLTHLSLALEVFYQRALSGEQLPKDDVAQWRSWLNDIRQILSSIEDAGVMPGLPDVALWRRAKPTIDNFPGIVFDASTAAALSLVLLPRQHGTPTGKDCLAAKSVLTFSKSLTYSTDFHEKVAPSAEELGPIRGFVNQIANRIQSDCAN